MPGLASILGFVVAVVASVAGTYIYMNWRFHLRVRPLRKILDLGKEEIRLVFAHREQASFVLPRTSTEDFLAMNNTISALHAAGCTQVCKARDPGHLAPADRHFNLFCFCSGKTNSVTKSVEKELRKKQLPIFYFLEGAEADEYVIMDPAGGSFPSKSFGERTAYLEEGIPEDRLLEKRFHDLAIITKATNPWNALAKVFIIAGIRGIGTWGAAECLKKNWRPIYDRLGPNKRANFSALIAVTYENCDIVNTEVVNLRLLE